MGNLVSTPLVGAWVIAIITAFVSGAENGCMALIGYVGQWLKSLKQFPTAASQAIILAGCVGIFAAFHHPASFPPPDEWVRQAAIWALAVLGVSSIAGGTSGAPKTDSITGGKP